MEYQFHIVKEEKEVLVIETSVVYDFNHNIADHQQRIIEVDSWDAYIESVKNNEQKFYKGTIHGNTIPKMSKIYNLEYDEDKLSVDITGYVNSYTLMATRLHESYELNHNIEKVK